MLPQKGSNELALLGDFLFKTCFVLSSRQAVWNSFFLEFLCDMIFFSKPKPFSKMFKLSLQHSYLI